MPPFYFALCLRMIWCASNVTHAVVFIEEMPLTETGKIDKNP